MRTTAARGGPEVVFQVRRTPPQLTADVVEHLHRIAAEALHNCVKHAAAGTVVVRVDLADDALVLEVRDDGAGFDPSCAERRHGYGTATMRERAELCRGRLTLTSAPGRGTAVRVDVPLH